MNPTYFKAAGAGLISSRSDWSPTATQVVFQCGPTLLDHQDRSQGEFLIFRSEWLAAQAKLYSQSGLDQDTQDHNCLTVDGANQIYGQMGASILLDENTPSYSYVMANVAPAYGGTLKSYTREFLFLKPNYVIVRDLPVPTNPASHLTWNLQTLAPAILGGNTFSMTLGHSSFFGLSAGPNFNMTQVLKTPDQSRPTYRLSLPPDPVGNFLVALETAPSSQTTATLALQKSGLPGFICGNGFVGWAYGPISYTSPVSGPHLLIGLKPNTPYYINGSSSLTTSAAGILAWNSLTPVGTTITITEQPVVTPPPPVPAVTVVTGKKYAYVMANGVITLTEVGS